jgi:hypothetical protein
VSTLNGRAFGFKWVSCVTVVVIAWYVAIPSTPPKLRGFSTQPRKEFEVPRILVKLGIKRVLKERCELADMTVSLLLFSRGDSKAGALKLEVHNTRRIEDGICAGEWTRDEDESRTFPDGEKRRWHHLWRGSSLDIYNLQCSISTFLQLREESRDGTGDIE